MTKVRFGIFLALLLSVSWSTLGMKRIIELESFIKAGFFSEEQENPDQDSLLETIIETNCPESLELYIYHANPAIKIEKLKQGLERAFKNNKHKVVKFLVGRNMVKPDENWSLKSHRENNAAMFLALTVPHGNNNKMLRNKRESIIFEKIYSCPLMVQEFIETLLKDGVKIKERFRELGPIEFILSTDFLFTNKNNVKILKLFLDHGAAIPSNKYINLVFPNENPRMKVISALEKPHLMNDTLEDTLNQFLSGAKNLAALAELMREDDCPQFTKQTVILKLLENNKKSTLRICINSIIFNHRILKSHDITHYISFNLLTDMNGRSALVASAHYDCPSALNTIIGALILKLKQIETKTLIRGLNNHDDQNDFCSTALEIAKE